MTIPELAPKISDAKMKEINDARNAFHLENDYMSPPNWSLYEELSSKFGESLSQSFFTHFVEWYNRTVVKKTYIYFTTFTWNPKEPQEKLKELIITVLPYRKALCITRFTYTEEHTDSNYHIHAIIYTSKPLKKDRMKNYEKYGKINHQPCKSEADAFTYINKENPSHTIVP